MNNTISLAKNRGWKVFPLVHSSRFAITQPLLSQATSSIEQIEQWQQQFPQHDWAVTTGPQSNLLAIEFSLDLGISTLRARLTDDSLLADALQIHSSHSLTTFHCWPSLEAPSLRRGQIAPGIRLYQHGDFVAIPSGEHSKFAPGRLVDRGAPIGNIPVCLLELALAPQTARRSAKILHFPSTRSVPMSVLFIFSRKRGLWICDFYSTRENKEHLKTLVFSSSDKVTEIAKRGNAPMDVDNQKSLFGGIEHGQGSILLNLTPTQYERLLAA